MRASLPVAAPSHAGHASTGDTSNASAMLARLPYGTRDWKQVLSCLIKLHNGSHARRDKRVSFKTMQERGGFLFRFFEELTGCGNTNCPQPSC